MTSRSEQARRTKRNRNEVEEIWANERKNPRKLSRQKQKESECDSDGSSSNTQNNDSDITPLSFTEDNQTSSDQGESSDLGDLDRDSVDDNDGLLEHTATTKISDDEDADLAVDNVIKSWGNWAPVCPDQFLMKILHVRGYDLSTIEPREFRRKPTKKQLEDYSIEILDAIRNSDVETIRSLHASGVSMDACNLYSESLLHRAARRGSFEIVDLLLKCGADIDIVDDYGRTPLHDACWRIETDFNIITLLLDKKLDMLRTADIRGSCPLSYVRNDQWLRWCAFFFYKKEIYWKPTDAALSGIVGLDSINEPGSENISVEGFLSVNDTSPGLSSLIDNARDAK